MTIRILSVNGVPYEEHDVLDDREKEVGKIECWYDRHYRHWVIYPVDAEGNQLEEATYGFGKKEAMEIKAEMEERLIGRSIYEAYCNFKNKED